MRIILLFAPLALGCHTLHSHHRKPDVDVVLPTASIDGMVANPGILRIDRGMSLREALASAGGATGRNSRVPSHMLTVGLARDRESYVFPLDYATNGYGGQVQLRDGDRIVVRPWLDTELGYGLQRPAIVNVKPAIKLPKTFEDGLNLGIEAMPANRRPSDSDRRTFLSLAQEADAALTRTPIDPAPIRRFCDRFLDDVIDDMDANLKFKDADLGDRNKNPVELWYQRIVDKKFPASGVLSGSLNADLFVNRAEVQSRHPELQPGSDYAFLVDGDAPQVVIQRIESLVQSSEDGLLSLKLWDRKNESLAQSDGDGLLLIRRQIGAVEHWLIADGRYDEDIDHPASALVLPGDRVAQMDGRFLPIVLSSLIAPAVVDELKGRRSKPLHEKLKKLPGVRAASNLAANSPVQIPNPVPGIRRAAESVGLKSSK